MTTPATPPSIAPQVRAGLRRLRIPTPKTVLKLAAISLGALVLYKIGTRSNYARQQERDERLRMSPEGQAKIKREGEEVRAKEAARKKAIEKLLDEHFSRLQKIEDAKRNNQ